MFCVKQQTVCLRDGTRITFKSEGSRGQNIVEISCEGEDAMHQLHFLKGGEIIRIETIKTGLTNGASSGMETRPVPTSR